MNHRAVWAIYRFEMARTGRTIFQSIVSPVLSTVSMIQLPVALVA